MSWRPDEFSSDAYTQNGPDRCFHCKTELYGQISELAPSLQFDVILNGANIDDLGDYRPGLRAAANFDVRSPLADCGFCKSEVRELAEHWRLPVWDKPATPCLSSRVAYGQAVTPERLSMIDQAEGFLRSNGFAICRVRYHEGDLARIEVPADQISRLMAAPVLNCVHEKLREIGFRFVTVDLGGFRSGSLNQAIMSSSKSAGSTPAGVPFVSIDAIERPDSTNP